MNRKKASLIVVLLVVAGTLYFGWAILPKGVSAGTLYVGGGGPGNYTTIQEAIDVSAPGDTIYVYAGTYFENVVVNETLSLIGEDKNTTIIDGGGTGDVVSIVADWVNISQFTVSNSGTSFYDAGIAVSSSSNSLISNISVLNSSMGILLLSSNNNTIVDYCAFNNSENIHLEFSDFNTIANSTVVSRWHGINLEYSHNNAVIHNNVTGEGGGISLQFSHFNLISNNTVQNCRYSIDLWYSDNNTLADNDISWSRYEGVYADHSNKNAFFNNTISHNPEGISIGYSNDLTFRDNVMVGNGFQLWGNSAPEHWNSHIIDVSNTVNGRPVYYWKNITGGAIPPGAGQVLLYNCTDVVVENQNLSEATVGLHSVISLGLEISNNSISSNEFGIWLQKATDANITGNILANSWDILVKGSNYNTVAYNTGPNDRGIWLDDSHNNTISNNSKSTQLLRSHDNLVTGNNVSSGRGLEIVGSIDNTISLNTISTDWGWRGLHLAGIGNTVVNNTVFNSSGIEFFGSSKNIIHNNQFTNNRDGMMLFRSTENLIENNTISLSNDTGIELVLLSDNNTFANNTISSNGLYGILIRSSFNNVIYHNEFINNTDQAFNNVNCSNRWDNGYPMGGNYWSDYTGVDNFSGPNQDQPGGDGIGDTPYDIQGGFDRDRYPLTAPFEMIHPLPPRMVQAHLSGLSSENVTLTWTLSLDDGGGFGSVIGYRIYRNLTYDPVGLGYSLIASLPNGTHEFLDMMAGEGDPDNYFYQVCAFDIENHTRCAENQAGKFTRSLSEGSNLLSVPLVQSDESVEVVLQTVSFDSAWFYDAIIQGWKSYAGQKPYPMTLRKINHTMGIWVNVTEDSNLTAAGVVPYETTIHLRTGWNLVGFPSFQQGYQVADLKADVSADRVERYYPFWPPYHLRALEDFEVLVAGYGYWIHVPRNTVWTLTNG